MMFYKIFIDESGSFEKNNDGSIVAALITTSEVAQIRERLSREIAILNNEYSTDFDVDKDIHIAAVMVPEKAFKPEEKARFMKIKQVSREAFAKKCLEVILKHTEKIVYSNNKKGIDEQSRYGNCLQSVINESLLLLKNPKTSDRISIIISPRNECCLSVRKFDWKEYHDNLCDSLKEQYQIDLGVSLDRVGIPTKNDEHFGCRMADVACYFTRFEKELIPPTLVREAKVKPSDIEIKKLIVSKSISDEDLFTAYKLSKDERVLKKLPCINEIERFEKNATDFCQFAFELIDKRTVIPNAIDEAVKIFLTVESTARDKFSKNSSNRNLFEAILASLDGQIACINHQGLKGKQESLECEYYKLVSEFKALTPSLSKRRERTLQFRNKAYNDEFNDYNFQHILDVFKDEVDKRITESMDEKDDLTGQMCGTIGQANAFLARAENTEFRSAEAKKYFTQSFKHLLPSHMYHDMSVNYLATMLWAEKDYSSAISSIP